MWNLNRKTAIFIALLIISLCLSVEVFSIKISPPLSREYMKMQFNAMNDVTNEHIATVAKFEQGWYWKSGLFFIHLGAIILNSILLILMIKSIRKGG